MCSRLTAVRKAHRCTPERKHLGSPNHPDPFGCTQYRGNLADGRYSITGMSVLTLVRHGQASYMSENYDKLSPLGERQSRMLGDHWARQSITFDRVFRGPAQRHRRTAELIGEAFRDAGVPWPEPEMLSELDEFDAFQMMKTMVPILVERHEHIRALDAEFRASQQTPEAGRLLERLFEEVAR